MLKGFHKCFGPELTRWIDGTVKWLRFIKAVLGNRATRDDVEPEFRPRMV